MRKEIMTVGNPDMMDVFNEEKITITPQDQLLLDAINSLEYQTPTPGKIVSGTYVGTTEHEILFDIGFKDYVRVEKKGDEIRVAEALEIGEVINVAILYTNDAPEFTIRGSVSVIAEQEAKRIMKDKMARNIFVTAKIREMNPAGYILEVQEANTTLIGFMPNTIAGANRISNPSSIVGETMEVMIESYSNDKGTYILSRKRFLEGMINETRDQLEIGEIDEPYTGRITGATNFGVFVEFNDCLTGMIHEANLNKEALEEAGIKKLQDIPAGTEIAFYVKEVLQNKRIILTQTFRPSLWDTASNGDVFEGIVKNVKSFGTLVKLDDETQGLIHVSEVKKAGVTLEYGDTVKVKVISIQKSERKMYLSIEN